MIEVPLYDIQKRHYKYRVDGGFSLIFPPESKKDSNETPDKI
jgi:hypothetical protein